MNNENREHCKYIAETVKAYANGEMYKCPECGEEFELYDTLGENHFFDEEENEIGRCPNCHHTSEYIDDFEQLSLYDYFGEGGMLDIDYIVASDRKTVKAVRILVAFGGPNIYIDTLTRNVELYWWNERASYPLSHDVCDEIDEWANELWGC